MPPMASDDEPPGAVVNSSHGRANQLLSPTTVGAPRCEMQALGHERTSQQPSQGVQITARQLYHVPQLQEPPRRRNWRLTDNATLQVESDGVIGSLQASNHALQAFTQPLSSSTINWSASLPESVPSSSLISFRESPLTPWDSNYGSPAEKKDPPTIRGLRPTANTFLPPTGTACSPATLGSQPKTLGSVAGDANVGILRSLPSSIPSSTGSSFGLFFPADTGGVALPGLGASTPVVSPNGGWPAAFCRPQSGNAVVISPGPLMTHTAELNVATTPQASRGSPLITAHATPDGSGRFGATFGSLQDKHALDDGANEAVAGNNHFSPSSTRSYMGSTGTTQDTDDDDDGVYLGPSTNHVQGKPSSPSASPSKLHAGEEPVWEERPHPNSFKTQRLNKEVFQEMFEGAFDVLATLNPDHYCMPYGSRVICIKSSSVTNMVLSIKNGVWSCPAAVFTRVNNIFDGLRKDSEKLLLLFSIPGSKHFCGLAEVLGFNPKDVTDFWEERITYTGTMTLRWLFCKVVPYEEVRKEVEPLHPAISTTQMWNGMHYEESVGRDVIKSYVEHPHTENLVSKHKALESALGLAAKRGGSSRGTRNNRGVFGGSRGAHGDRGSANAPRGNHGDRGSFQSPRGNHGDRSSMQSRSTLRNGTTPGRGDFQRGARNGFGTPQPGQQSQHQEQQDSVHTPSVTSASSQPAFERTPTGNEKPKLQTMSVYVHEDGSITPAIPIPGASQGISATRNAQPSISSSASHSVTDNMGSSLEHSPRFEQFLRKASSPQEHMPVKTFTPTKQGSSTNTLRCGVPKSSPSHFNRRKETERQLGSPLQMHSPPAQPQSNHHLADVSPTPFAPGSANRRGYMQLPKPRMQPLSAATLQTWMHEHGQQRQDQQDPFHQAQYTQPFRGGGVGYVHPFGLQGTTGPSLPPAAMEPVPRNQVRTPSIEKGGRLGQGVRGTEAKSSIDLRTDSWVDKLLASPGSDREESRTTGSFGGVGNTFNVQGGL